MKDQAPQAWHIEIHPIGNQCLITCNGEPVYASAATVHMEVGVPTTLHLKFPVYGPTPRTFERQDALTADGSPMVTTIEFGGRCYRLMDITEGDLDHGFFGARRSKS